MEKQVNADKGGGGVQATSDVHILGIFEPTFWMIRITKNSSKIVIHSLFLLFLFCLFKQAKQEKEGKESW